jgi:hypothetical protein
MIHIEQAIGPKPARMEVVVLESFDLVVGKQQAAAQVKAQQRPCDLPWAVEKLSTKSSSPSGPRTIPRGT